MKKYFMLSVDEDFCSRYFEDFVCKEFGMNVCSTGCGSVEFTSSKKPKNFESRLRKRFGTITDEVIQWMYIKEDDT